MAHIYESTHSTVQKMHHLIANFQIALRIDPPELERPSSGHASSHTSTAACGHRM